MGVVAAAELPLLWPRIGAAGGTCATSEGQIFEVFEFVSKV